MGQCQKSCSPAKNEKAYFTHQRKEMLNHFAKSRHFFENSSEWVVIFKEELRVYSDCQWAMPLLSLIKSWESYHDTSSRVVFMWNQFNSTRSIPIVDQSRACMWPQSIANLQTFTYEIETDPHKKTLNGLIQHKKDCTIYKIIQIFKLSFIRFYCEKNGEDLKLRESFKSTRNTVLLEIDQIVLDFIRIIIKVVPKFFIDFPAHIQDMEEIVRSAIVSEDVLKLLVMIRQETFGEVQQEYVRSLAEFDNNKGKSSIEERLISDKDQNYLKAINSLLEIPACRSIGEIHDVVAMLMNYISMGLFDESREDNLLEEEEIIQAFLVIICKSGVVELPLYVDVLNKFLDNNTLTIKSVGQGIVKMTYIINNSSEWGSFLSNC